MLTYHIARQEYAVVALKISNSIEWSRKDGRKGKEIFHKDPTLHQNCGLNTTGVLFRPNSTPHFYASIFISKCEWEVMTSTVFLDQTFLTTIIEDVEARHIVLTASILGQSPWSFTLFECPYPQDPHWFAVSAISKLMYDGQHIWPSRMWSPKVEVKPHLCCATMPTLPCNPHTCRSNSRRIRAQWSMWLLSTVLPTSSGGMLSWAVCDTICFYCIRWMCHPWVDIRYTPFHAP